MYVNDGAGEASESSTFLLADVYSEQYMQFAVCIFIFVLVFENNSIKQVTHNLL